MQANTPMLPSAGPLVPPLLTKDMEPELWLEQFNLIADHNSWSDTVKLLVVPSYLPPKASKWCLLNKFSTWQLFNKEFLDTFCDKPSLDAIVSKVLNFKMRSNEKIADYVTRFKLLHTEYVKCSVNNVQDVDATTSQAFSSAKQDGESSSVGGSHSLPPSPSLDQESESSEPQDPETRPLPPRPSQEDYTFVIGESGFIKHFVSRIRSSLVKTEIRRDRPKNLSRVYKLAVRYYEDFDEDEDAVPQNKSRKTMKSAALFDDDANQNSSVASANSDLESMTKLMSQMVSIIGQQQSTKKGSPGSSNNVNKPMKCYSCDGEGHLIKDCTNPCKLCNQDGHKHYECSKYKPKSNRSPMTGLLMEEHVLVSEHKRPVEETLSNTVAKKIHLDNHEESSSGTTRSGKVYLRDIAPATNQRDIAVEVSHTANVTEPNIPITTEPTDSSNILSPRIDIAEDVIPTQVGPVHPYEPSVVAKPNKLVEYEMEHKRKVQQIIDRVVNEPVHILSVKDISLLSPVARSGLKNAVNKPQAAHLASSLLIEEDAIMLKGAPRVEGLVNDVPCQLILDTGCTGVIITYKFAKKIGLTELDQVDNVAMTFANGKSYKPLGVARNLSVKVNSVFNTSFDAYCFETEGEQYDFIIGLKGLHKLGISANFQTFQWWINTPVAPIMLDVKYGVDINNSEEQTVFLVLPDNDSYDQVAHFPHVDSQDTKTNYDPRLGDLPKRIMSYSMLTKDQKHKLIDLVVKYKDCFGTGYNHLKQTNLVKFHVNTGDAAPIYKRPYAFLTNSDKAFMKEDLKQMVDAGVVIPTLHSKESSNNGGWSFPCRYVYKKNGDRRLVSNFSALNKVTVRDPFPLPNLVDVLEALAGSCVFSPNDMLKGFHSIAVDEESINKLTITTPHGLYSYCTLPFGCLNGPSCYARAIHLAMEPFLNVFAVVYLDDITLYDNDIENHFVNLEKYFERLLEINMVLNANKCDFFQDKISLLGFEVSSDGISPSPLKINKIMDYPRLANVTDVRAFVNLCSFFRRHVNGFADLSAPLNALLKKGVPFKWNQEHEQAFVKLKLALKNACTLSLPQDNLPYNLYTDSSEIGIGACLTQVQEDGSEKPVCFVSRQLQPVEQRYPTVEKEILSTIYALVKLRKYLLDRQFTLFTDSTALKYLFQKELPSQRLQRWILCTNEFTFTIKTLSSKANCVADALSRYPSPTSQEQVSEPSGEDCIDLLFDNLFIENTAYDYEPWLQDLKYLMLNPNQVKASDKLKVLSLKYKIGDDNKLFRKISDRFVEVPLISTRSTILKAVHDGMGHFGLNSSWNRLYLSYWWPGCYVDLKKYLQSCRECQLYSDIEQINPPSRTIPIHHVFEQYALDFVGPLPKSKSGNTYILVACEAFSRWPIALATAKCDANTVAAFLYNSIFTVFGPIKTILTDNASHFDNQIIDSLLAMIKVRHVYSAAYRPTTNGRVENLNGILVKAIKKLSVDDPSNWDANVPAVLYALRTKIHTSLKISPFECLYGIPPKPWIQDPLQELGRSLGWERLNYLQDRNVQIDVYNVLNDTTHEEFIQESDTYVKKKFPPGCQVVKFRPNKSSKLDSNYKEDIFNVVACFDNGTVQLSDLGGRLLKRRSNITGLRRWYSRE